MADNKQQVNSFDVLKEMGVREMDIRATGGLGNLINVRRNKHGGEITLGVDAGTCSVIMDMAAGGPQTHQVTLLVFNFEQFRQVQKELADGRSGEAESGDQG